MRQDYRAFYHAEVLYRKRSMYPPFTIIARLVFSSKDVIACESAANEAKTSLDIIIRENGLDGSFLSVSVTEAPIKRIKDEFRYQLVAKLYTGGEVEKAESVLKQIEQSSNGSVRIELEINPNNMF